MNTLSSRSATAARSIDGSRNAANNDYDPTWSHSDSQIAFSSVRTTNVGTGSDLSIRELAEMICRTVGFDGSLRFDATKPDGTPQKLLDISKLSGMGWTAKIPLQEGLEKTYRAVRDRLS